jgi:acetyltransferase-like isoleucine patch superfamily enzyme
MASRSRIRAFTVCKNLELIEMGESSSIGQFNHITGFPAGTNSRAFAANKDRKPHLIMGKCAAVTSQHILDCTDTVTIGPFSTIGGFRSQVMTHAIDLARNVQDCAPITIGDHSFVGTDTTILPGSVLPDKSVLGAKSLLNKSYDAPGYLYAGVPAVPVKPCPEGGFFTRTEGFTW